MLSRIADSLFWINRYMERSDGLIRGIKTHYILLLDKGVNQNLSWKPLLEIYTNCSISEIAAIHDNTEVVLSKLLLDITNPNSLKILMSKTRENARGVQDHITKELWEHVNQMYHRVNSITTETHLKGNETIATIDDLEQNCILYNGVSDTTMPRGLGWSFMNLGRYIERCILTIDISSQYFQTIHFNTEKESDILQWRPLLLSLSGYELHLKSYHSNHHNQNTIHQVLFNENFTRSVIYTLKRINKYFNDVIKNNYSEEMISLTKHLGRLLSKIQYTEYHNFNALLLQEFINEIRRELIEFSSLLGKHFFSYA